MATTLAFPPPQTQPRRIAQVGGLFLACCLFFAIAFPKGGLKIYGVPLTFGYALTVVMIVNAGLWMRQLAVPLDRAIVMATCLLLGLWSAASLYSNGTEDYGYTLAYFISVLYLPFFGLFVFSATVLAERSRLIETTLVWAIRFVIAYGIMLFVFKTATGRWIEIPYLTVNADDLGTLDDKFINRGGIFKLISTYNNGNIFGVAMCIVGPLYLRLERNRVWRILFYAGLVLTLSRTVWIGILAILTMRSLSAGVRVTTFIYGALSVLAVSVALYFVLDVLGRDMSFIFDKQLGGRVDQLSAFSEASLFSQRPGKPLSEIVYSGVLANYGWFGLVLFVVFLLMPSLMMKMGGVRLLSMSRASACLQGLALYVVIAGSDAAFSYIPVMMIFWMIAGLGLWYGEAEARRRVINAHPR